MAGPQKWTEEIIAQRVKDGRGRGEGVAYSPWLFVQEFSSKGTQTRVPGFKVKRTVHTFSYLERALFLNLEFLANFGYFQEQYPMDRAVTLGAAQALGIKHPTYPRSRIPVVMTMDALVGMKDATGQISMAGWDVKPSSQLLKPRVAEKLSLHKAYCAHIGIPHYLFTEKSISRDVTRNIDWVRMSLPKDGELETVPGIFTWRTDQMLEQVAKAKSTTSISKFCGQYDFVNRLEPGTGLRVFKMLLWGHRLQMNMDVKWIEREPLSRLKKGLVVSRERKAA